MKALVLNYTHPEGYPPTFNAINNLSKNTKKVIVLSTNTLETKWKYDNNVELHLLNAEKDRFKSINRSKFRKVKDYFNYGKSLFRLLKKNKPDLVLIYDNVPFLFYYIVSKVFLSSKKTKVWYHNHDVFPLSYYKKYSINWFGAICEQKKLNIADYFSLPANERKEYFPMNNYNGKYFFLPNYPSIHFHGQIDIVKKHITDKVNIIYPGNICEKHGFEDIITILNKKIDGKTIHLTLLGDITENYKSTLLKIAKEHSCLNNLIFKERVSYFDVPKVMEYQHIGWAVNKPLDVTYSTGGTAANKIYEFLALGMPIILFDNKHYRDYLEGNDWAIFSNLSEDSLIESIRLATNEYASLSMKARESFEKNYSFETHFDSVFKKIKSEIT